MATRFIETEKDRAQFLKFVEQVAIPSTITITPGGKRTIRQNRLNRLWVHEIADQMGETTEYVRAYCKLTIGVPILRAEDEDFREKYDVYVRPMEFENKIALMSEPFDFPVTRLMNVKQQKQYLDEIYRHFSERGFSLTDPETLRFGPLVNPSNTNDIINDPAEPATCSAGQAGGRGPYRSPAANTARA